MKTLSDFKKELAAGHVWELTQYFTDNINNKKVTLRTVDKIQSNGVYFKMGDDRPWLDFPKAGECSFDGDSVTINHGFCVLIYKIINSKP